MLDFVAVLEFLQAAMRSIVIIKYCGCMMPSSFVSKYQQSKLIQLHRGMTKGDIVYLKIDHNRIGGFVDDTEK